MGVSYGLMRGPIQALMKVWLPDLQPLFSNLVPENKDLCPYEFNYVRCPHLAVETNCPKFNMMEVIVL
eukprot:13708272-Ditylum_brightwellii.AAC.1